MYSSDEIWLDNGQLLKINSWTQGLKPVSGGSNPKRDHDWGQISTNFGIKFRNITRIDSGGHCFHQNPLAASRGSKSVSGVSKLVLRPYFWFDSNHVWHDASEFPIGLYYIGNIRGFDWMDYIRWSWPFGLYHEATSGVLTDKIRFWG
jgi:hypothetical protein